MRLGLEDALVSGIPVGVGQICHCDVCGANLRPNDRVEVLVLIDGTEIDVVTTRGECCARGSLEEGTQRPCWLARGTLAASIGPGGHSRLILAGASVIDRAE
ncbi:hypothetical protein [Halomontanus rarus]|uniref:hypothetical protein n=1 Tax=Halomontanus rarus TaxID=3034020 RepID=UPI0023E800BE|nr:hypothetical protein [Halovivax sp. TS33]